MVLSQSRAWVQCPGSSDGGPLAPTPLSIPLCWLLDTDAARPQLPGVKDHENLLDVQSSVGLGNHPPALLSSWAFVRASAGPLRGPVCPSSGSGREGEITCTPVHAKCYA